MTGPLLTRAVGGARGYPVPEGVDGNTTKYRELFTTFPGPIRATRSPDVPMSHVGKTTAFDREALRTPKVR
jgi:hypothetical protein